MEIPIVVTEDEINVAGFVDQIDLSVDVGPQGRRGSITFSGPGSPPTAPDSSVTDIYGMVDVFEPGDLYIQTGSGTPNYAYLYIYQQHPGGNTWEPICPLQPALYNSDLVFTFTSGVSNAIEISLEDILGTTTTAIPGSDFILQATAAMNDSDVYIFSVKSAVVNNGTGLLSVVLNCKKIAGTTITAPTGNITVNTSIGIKN